MIGLDHVAVDDKITACGISYEPLEDGSVDVAFSSLSFTGRNWKPLQEAIAPDNPILGLLLVGACLRNARRS